MLSMLLVLVLAKEFAAIPIPHMAKSDGIIVDQER